MMRISFKDDYSEGAHPEILKALVKDNLTPMSGYGEDEKSEKAKHKIFEALKNANSQIHFVAGGTQANLIVISSALRAHEAVIAAETGHISTHETGAVEATGHKVISVQAPNGKLEAKAIQQALEDHPDEHMVKPRMVYVSQSTELGTIYSLEELKEISQICKEKDLLFFVDGARLGVALTSKEADFTLEDLAKFCDVFYIGGTKNGAMFGEAIVLNNPSLQADFRYHIKQKGGLLAKGRFLGIQFDVLLTNHLFFDLAKNANQQAEYFYKALKNLGVEFKYPFQTNQLFPILSEAQLKKIQKDFDFHIWEKQDQDFVIRLVTSWATPQENIDKFLKALEN